MMPAAPPLIASFHLVRHPSRLAAMRHLGLGRRALARTDGLVFWRLLGTGDGAHTGPGADLARTALFALWRSADRLDEFVAAPTWGDDVVEHWHTRLHAAGGHGTWRGRPVLDQITPALGSVSGSTDREATRDVGGPVAIITRADVRLGAWRPFRAAGDPVDGELQRADGLLAVVGIGEAPVGRLGTFSLWRSMADARTFASTPKHRSVVADTRRGRWYTEELFARFQPYDWEGRWDGRDPLAGFGTSGNNIP